MGGLRSSHLGPGPRAIPLSAQEKSKCTGSGHDVRVIQAAAESNSRSTETGFKKGTRPFHRLNETVYSLHAKKPSDNLK